MEEICFSMLCGIEGSKERLQVWIPGSDSSSPFMTDLLARRGDSGLLSEVISSRDFEGASLGSQQHRFTTGISSRPEDSERESEGDRSCSFETFCAYP